MSSVYDRERNLIRGAREIHRATGNPVTLSRDAWEFLKRRGKINERNYLDATIPVKRTS